MYFLAGKKYELKNDDYTFHLQNCQY